MEKGIRSSKWGISFLCAVIVLFIFVCLSVFLIDPFFQFGVHDNQYLLNAAYVDAGLIKNYDYDAVIIGSCMVENYDIETFNNAFGVKAVKIGCGGLGPDGVMDYLLLANRVGKARNYYINIDFASFAGNGDDEAVALDEQREINIDEYSYLLKDDPLSRLRYMFSYEAWFRFIPVDLGLTAYKMVKGDLSGGKLGVRTSVAHNGEWSDDYQYGEDVVMKSREKRNKNRAANSEAEQEKLLQSMIGNMEDFVDSIDFSAGHYIFIFPPYSYLFWEDAKQENKYAAYLEAKNYMTDRIKKAGGEVYDFQSADIIYDLNNYKDTSHFRKEINDYMIQCMASGQYKR